MENEQDSLEALINAPSIANHKVEIMNEGFRKDLYWMEDGFHFVIHTFTKVIHDDPHDHPWDFTTFILQGGYEEEYFQMFESPSGVQYVAKKRFCAPGTSLHVSANHIHRITRLPSMELPVIYDGEIDAGSSLNRVLSPTHFMPVPCKTLVIPGKPSGRKSGFYRFRQGFPASDGNVYSNDIPGEFVGNHEVYTSNGSSLPFPFPNSWVCYRPFDSWEWQPLLDLKMFK